MKIYYLTKHGLKFDCRGYFDSNRENLEEMLKDFPDWRIEEQEIKVPGRLV